MTPADPVLASFVALLCKISSYAKANGIEYSLASHFSGAPFTFSAEEIFSNKIVAPIIRHLIEEEMERRGHCWIEGKHPLGKYSCNFIDVSPEEKDSAKDDNKTRAVALAAYRTGER